MNTKERQEQKKQRRREKRDAILAALVPHTEYLATLGIAVRCQPFKRQVSAGNDEVSFVVNYSAAE